MKKLLSLLLALMMLHVPAMTLAENLPDLDGELIGGADGPTEILVANEAKLPAVLGEEALAAGRRVTSTMTITELSGVETGDPATDAAISDLINALALSIAQQGDEFDLAVQLSGQDALTFGAAVNGEDCYIKSNLIGGAIVVNANEIEPLVNRLLDMMVMMEAMTEEDAAALREQLTVMMDTYASTMESSMESVMAMEELESLNTAALEQLYASMQDKIEVVDVVTVPKMCDPATEAVQLVLTNEDMAAAMKNVYQFLLDNPALMDYLGSMLGFSTEAELDMIWETSGEIYKTYGLYESEEEFRADNMTFKQIVETAMAELDGRKVLDGEFTMMMAADENGEIVWGTMSLPVYIEEESVVDAAQTVGETTQIDLTYTRQTVAAGVAHTCNITVEGETVTIDALVGEGSTVISMGGMDAQANAIKLLDVTINTAEDNQLTVEANVYDGEVHGDGSEAEVVCQLLLEGECEFTDVRSYFAGTLTVNVPNGEADAAAVEIIEGENTVDVPIDTTKSAEAAAPAEPAMTTMVFELSSDYAVSGVDFTGVTKLSAEVEGVRVGLQVASETTDPVASIMSGDVTRPAELDDATFANWFVRVINALNSWMSTVLMALPESVLTLILSASMY